MIVSVTELMAYRRCHRMWGYSHLQNLRKIVPPNHYILGTLMHNAHEVWLLAPHRNFSEIFLLCAKDELDKIKAAFYQVRGIHADNEKDLSGIMDQIDLGMNMCDNYQEYYKVPLEDNFELLSAEQRIVVNIPGTQHQLEARLDGLLRSKRSGKIYVLEHKTYGAKPDVANLESNYQFLGYIWVANQLQIGEVVGIAYDGMMKKKAAPRAGLESLFFRTTIHRNKYAIQEFETMLGPEVDEMASRAVLSKNRKFDGCHDCLFERLCYAETNHEDVNYYMNNYYVNDKDNP